MEVRSTRWKVHGGEVSERPKEHAWKACVWATAPRVRIPPSPPLPLAFFSFGSFFKRPWLALGFRKNAGLSQEAWLSKSFGFFGPFVLEGKRSRSSELGTFVLGKGCREAWRPDPSDTFTIDHHPRGCRGPGGVGFHRLARPAMGPVPRGALGSNRVRPGTEQP